jgi:transposase InsO family protein
VSTRRGNSNSSETGELFPLIIVTDNGAAFRSLDFQSFIESRPELAHVRTRNHAPETNGVVERFNRTIEYEHLYRLEIANGDELAHRWTSSSLSTTRSGRTKPSTKRCR